jgi:hypothetical protein
MNDLKIGELVRVRMPVWSAAGKAGRRLVGEVQSIWYHPRAGELRVLVHWSTERDKFESFWARELEVFSRSSKKKQLGNR